MTDQTPSPWSRPEGQPDPTTEQWGPPGSAAAPAPVERPLYPGGPPSSSFSAYPTAAPNGYPGATDYGRPTAPANPYQAPGYPLVPLRTDYAPWGKRVGALLLDHLVSYLGLIVFWIGYGMWLSDFVRTSDLPSLSQGAGLVMVIGSAIILVGTGINIYNRWIVAGRTGQSFGKRVTKIKLIGEESGVPIGGLNAFLRDLVHTLDGFAYVGYLWPLWDQQRQTFSDKLMKTIVVRTDVSND